MAKVEWFKGIFPALITPMTKEGEIDEDNFKTFLDYIVPKVDGVVVCGTTGEVSSFTMEEKKKAIDIVVDKVGDKCPVIAGTGAPSTMEAIEITKYARDKGAKAALVVNPYYFKPNFNEIYDYYKELNKLDFPLIAYNFPQCSGSHHFWWTTEGICNLKNFIGLKDSSGNLAYFAAITDKLKDKISIFCGHDEVGQAALGMGADGVLLASVNLIPEIWRKIYNATKEKNYDEAIRLQSEIQMLVRIIVRNGGCQAIKEGLGMIGIPVGNSRLPIMPADSFRREDREELRIQLEKVGYITKKEIEFEVIPNKIIKSLYPAIPETPKKITNFVMKVGEGFAGPPLTELAHIDLLIGKKGGNVEKAIDKALAEKPEDRIGREVKILSEKPRTLMVPTVTIRSKKQARLVYEVAGEGVLQGIQKTIEDGILPEGILEDIVLLVNVFVHPSASNEVRIRINNFKAIRHAIRKALEERPSLEEMFEEKDVVRHPFRYSP